MRPFLNRHGLIRRRSRSSLTLIRWPMVCLLAIGVSVGAVTPHIDRIEPFLADFILIHFDAAPNYNYALDYTEILSNGVPVGPWTNLFKADASPSVQHYVVPDTKKRKQRFYRLVAYP